MEQAFGLSQQLFTGFCGLGLATAAIKQQDVQGVFYLADPVGQGARDQAALPGGGRKTAGFLDGQKHAEGIGREKVAGGVGHFLYSNNLNDSYKFSASN